MDPVLRFVALAALLPLVGFAGGSTPVFAADSPNVLFMICDDLNASFGPYPWDGKARHGFNVPHPTMKRPWGINGFEVFVPLSDVPHVPADSERGTP